MVSGQPASRRAINRGREEGGGAETVNHTGIIKGTAATAAQKGSTRIRHVAKGRRRWSPCAYRGRSGPLLSALIFFD